MTGNIIIQNLSDATVQIDIEGAIGIPEDLQFDTPSEQITTYDTFKRQLETLRAIEAQHILINIRSTGGNVHDALLIYEALRELPGEITTRCYGYVASAATLIAQAASPGKRQLSANGLYLIHKAVCSWEGNANELNETAELLDKTDLRIASLYAERSGHPVEQFIELMNCNNGNGKWLSPQEAIEQGLADTILGHAVNRSFSNLPDKALSDSLLIFQNQSPMTLRQHWNAILDLLGLSSVTRTTLSDTSEPKAPAAAIFAAKIEKTASETVQTESTDPPPSRAAQYAEFPTPNDLSSETYMARIRSLENQVAILEAKNARLKAEPTRTERQEDPSPSEIVPVGNARAYDEDLRNFR